MEDDPTFSPDEHFNAQIDALNKAIKEMRERKEWGEIDAETLRQAEEQYNRDIEKIAELRAEYGKKPN